MDYNELVERLEYYGNCYITGDNLGREIQGSGELMVDAATTITKLLVRVEKAEREWDAAIKDASDDNQKPLTLDELKAHLSKRHPHEIEPLYVMFEPEIPIDYATRWRNAYNLSQLVTSRAEEYGKSWIAYRYKPNMGTREETE